MKLVTVLRSGGEYSAEHVKWLHSQFPDTLQAICLSDCSVEGVETIPLRTNWSGWFAKLEMFNPSLIDDDIFYFDLDTVLCGDITHMAQQTSLIALSDFYHPQWAASGIMFIPHRSKAEIWDKITTQKDLFSRFRGDGEYLREIIEFERWQNICPGEIVSYKAHIASKEMSGFHPGRSTGNGQLPPGTKIICFHGKPRPWELSDLPWLPTFPIQVNF